MKRFKVQIVLIGMLLSLNYAMNCYADNYGMTESNANAQMNMPSSSNGYAVDNG